MRKSVASTSSYHRIKIKVIIDTFTSCFRGYIFVLFIVVGKSAVDGGHDVVLKLGKLVFGFDWCPSRWWGSFWLRIDCAITLRQRFVRFYHTSITRTPVIIIDGDQALPSCGGDGCWLLKYAASANRDSHLLFSLLFGLVAYFIIVFYHCNYYCSRIWLFGWRCSFWWLFL